MTKAKSPNRIKLELEYPLRSSANILFQYISTPSGLQSWFADHVEVTQGRYTFRWEDGTETFAEVMKNVTNKYIRFAVQNADFLLILGSRLNIRQISYNWQSFAKKAWKAMVDVDLAELEKPTISIDLKIHADLRHFIPKFREALVGYTPSKMHTEFLEWCKNTTKKYPTVLPEYKNSTLINPYYFIDELYKTLKEDDVIITGNGSACVITFQAAKLKEQQRLYTNSGSASMGYDLPAAIGASIALGGKRVICIAGDGSIMMNIQELSTVIGYRLPIKIIILNNNGYLSIRQTQEAYFPDNLIGIDQNNGVFLPDFVKLGNAIGIPSTRVNSIIDWHNQETQNFYSTRRNNHFYHPHLVRMHLELPIQDIQLDLQKQSL